LKDGEISKVIKYYDKDCFDKYIELNVLLIKAIDRHRKIREEVLLKLLDPNFSMPQGELIHDYAHSEEGLRYKILCKFHKMVLAREKKIGQPLIGDKKKKFLHLYEKRIRYLESFYYTKNEQGERHTDVFIEHYQSLHILKAMTKSLDPHSAYYSPDEAAELRAALKKQFHGIGIVLKENEEGVYISDLIMGGPAYTSGLLKVGDFVTSINGCVIHEMSFDEVLEHLRGEEDSLVELNIKRGEEGVSLIRLKRQKIVLHEERLSYTYEPYADGVIGKIILPGFYDNGEGVNSEKDLREAIRELKSIGPVYGLVIDLRENSGGFLSQAVKVSGLFITKGVIVISKYSDGEIRYMRDLDGRMYYQGPLVLLTSKASASAAEIVAQALQDYGVAVVVGDERTYGKGSMQYQTVMEDDAKTYFKVTVGRYYTISGRSTQIEGVLADIVVPTVFSPYNIGERYLEYPLPNDQLDMEAAISAKGQYKNFQKKYMPVLQVKETEWKKMIPSLKINSEKRLSKDGNFQCFLRKIRGEAPVESPYRNKRGASRAQDFGVEDLQIKETVNILKDMIYLQQAS
jgi:carboxyl-terminal processing protease